MELRWTEQAANDLERIADYLFDTTPERTAKLIRTLYDAPPALYFSLPRTKYVAMSFTWCGFCTARSAGLK